MKLCIGDIIKVSNGAIGVVNRIQCRDAEGHISDRDVNYLGQGMEVNDIYEFSIIPNKNVKGAWYRREELVKILSSASQYAVKNPADYYGRSFEY